MEPLHVKFEAQEAIDSKRMILMAEMDIVDASKHLQDYKVLRKKELTKKAELKSKLYVLEKKLNSMKIQLPSTNTVPMVEKIQKTKVEKEKSSSLEAELQQIKSKLARLNY